MIGFLLVMVLVLAVFALIGAIWGKEVAQSCFGLSAFAGVTLLSVVFLVIMIVFLATTWR